MHEVVKDLFLAGVILLFGGLAGAGLGGKIYGSLIGAILGVFLLAAAGIVYLAA